MNSLLRFMILSFILMFSLCGCNSDNNENVDGDDIEQDFELETDGDIEQEAETAEVETDGDIEEEAETAELETEADIEEEAEAVELETDGDIEEEAEAVELETDGDIEEEAETAEVETDGDIEEEAEVTEVETDDDIEEEAETAEVETEADIEEEVEAEEVIDLCDPDPCKGMDNFECDPESGSCICITGYVGESCNSCDEFFQDNDENGSCKLSCNMPEICQNGSSHYACDDTSGKAVCGCSYDNPQRIGRIGNYAVIDLSIDGNFMYALGTEGLLAYDISNSADPQLIHVMEGFIGFNIFYKGNTVFVTDFEKNLYIIDVSDKQNPEVLSTYYLGMYFLIMDVVDNNVYISKGDQQLSVLDISDPQNPQLTYSFPLNSAMSDIHILGTTAYVTTGDGLLIVDISDSGNFVLLSQYSAVLCSGVEIDGDRAYIVFDRFGVGILDITDKTNPQMINHLYHYNFYFQISNFVLSNQTAYVLDTSPEPYNSQIFMMDVSDPDNMELIGNIETQSTALGFSVVGDTLYVPDMHNGVSVLNVEDKSNPVEIYNRSILGMVTDVQVLNDVAYVADQFSGLYTIDVSDKLNPQVISNYDMHKTAMGIFVDSGLAYMVYQWNGFGIIDVSDPANPVEKYNIELENVVHDVFAVSDRLYVSNDLGGLLIYDTTDKTSPVLAGTYPSEQKVYQTIVRNNIAYLAADNRVVILDVSDPSNIIKISEYSSYADHINLDGDNLFTLGNGRIDVINVTDPASPYEPSPFSTNVSDGIDFAVSKNHVFVLTRSNDLRIFELSEEYYLNYKGFYDTVNDYAVFADNEILYVASGVTGLEILDTAVCVCEDHFTGDYCDSCLEGYAGDDCDHCADGYSGYPDCVQQ